MAASVFLERLRTVVSRTHDKVIGEKGRDQRLNFPDRDRVFVFRQGFEWYRAWIVQHNSDDTFDVTYVSPRASGESTSESSATGEWTAGTDPQRPETDEETVTDTSTGEDKRRPRDPELEEDYREAVARSPAGRGETVSRLLLLCATCWISLLELLSIT